MTASEDDKESGKESAKSGTGAPGRTAPALSAIALAAIGAIGFSGKAIIVKLAYRYGGVDAVMLIALRMIVALPFFILMGLHSQRKPDRQPLQRGDVWKIVLLGFLGYYLSSFLDFLGLKYVTATLERLILYLNPTMVLLITVVVYRFRARAGKPGDASQRYHVSGRQIVAMLISYAGVILAFAHDFLMVGGTAGASGGSNLMLGSALVFASALSYACYLFGSGELVKRVGSVRLTAYASCVACACCIVQYLVTRQPADWHAILDLPVPVYWLSLLNGTACTVLPIFLVMVAISRLGSSLASQIGMVGPVSTIVLSSVFLGEHMGVWQIAGTIMVMAGVLIVTQPARR